MFLRGSRYEPVETTSLLRADGAVIRYKRQRFVVREPGQLVHLVQEGERPDHIAWTVFRDPELWWRLADANADLSASELTEPAGRRLAIVLPVR